MDKFSTVSHGIISGLTMPSCSHKRGLATKIFHLQLHTYIRLLKNDSTNMLDLKQNIMRNQYHNKTQQNTVEEHIDN